MASRAEVLERPEPMAVPFWTSVAIHLVMVATVIVGAWAERTHHLNMGSQSGGGLGSVRVSPVSSIPLPSRSGPQNPVANVTESQVPTPPAAKQPKAKPAPKAPQKAVPLVFDTVPKKIPPHTPPAQPNSYRDQQKYNDNQLYSTSGQRLNSQDYNIQGGGGVRLGDSSPFGDQFGAYANLVRDDIARHWQPGNLNLRTTNSFVIVTFTIRRDGSIVNPKVDQSSGVSTLDNSALRAVMDAQPLQPLPSNFPRNQADVSMRFELGK